jgi:hypothetical protein
MSLFLETWKGIRRSAVTFEKVDDLAPFVEMQTIAGNSIGDFFYQIEHSGYPSGCYERLDQTGCKTYKDLSPVPEKGQPVLRILLQEKDGPEWRRSRRNLRNLAVAPSAMNSKSLGPFPDDHSVIAKNLGLSFQHLDHRGLPRPGMPHKEEPLAIQHSPARMKIEAVPIGEDPGQENLVRGEKGQRMMPPHGKNLIVFIIDLSMRMVAIEFDETMDDMISRRRIDAEINPRAIFFIYRPGSFTIDFLSKITLLEVRKREMMPD